MRKIVEMNGILTMEYYIDKTNPELAYLALDSNPSRKILHNHQTVLSRRDINIDIPLFKIRIP